MVIGFAVDSWKESVFSKMHILAIMQLVASSPLSAQADPACDVVAGGKGSILDAAADFAESPQPAK